MPCMSLFLKWGCLIQEIIRFHTCTVCGHQRGKVHCERGARRFLPPSYEWAYACQENHAARIFLVDHGEDCAKHMRHYHLCQVYANHINVPPDKLHPMLAPWPFSMWGIDVISLISPKASNRHFFILIAIDYFTK